MSEKDSIKPFHARDTAPGKEAADVVAEVLRHAQEREEAAKRKVAPKGPPKWMLPLTVNLGVLALYFLIAQPDWVVVNPIEDPRPAEIKVEQTRSAIWLATTRIDTFRQTNGRLPASLSEAGIGDLAAQGVNYSVQGDSTYLLMATVGTENIVFDSARQTPAEFAGNQANRISG